MLRKAPQKASGHRQVKSYQEMKIFLKTPKEE